LKGVLLYKAWKGLKWSSHPAALLRVIASILVFASSSLLLGQSTVSTKPSVAESPIEDSDQPVATPTLASDLNPALFLRRLAVDQKMLWISPFRVRKDTTANTLFSLSVVTGALIPADYSISRRISASPDRIRLSRDLANASVGAELGFAAGGFALGHFAHNAHAREYGYLSGEALANSLIIGSVVGLATGRDRPNEADGRGEFWKAGSSFPSKHATAAWTLAAVTADEYPGWLTKILAYGSAGAVSASRVASKDHFASDVLVGSALGWFTGHEVYRKHHNDDLPGQRYGTFQRAESERDSSNMGSPFVSMDSWVYPLLDRLVGEGFINDAILGTRPWTRMECARLTREAGEVLEADFHGDQVQRAYGALRLEFARELVRLEGGRNFGAGVDEVYVRTMGITGTPLTDGYHFAQTIINDYGRPYNEGSNIVVGLSTDAVAGPIALYLRGEYQYAPGAAAYSESVQQQIALADGVPFVSSSIPNGANRFRPLEAYVSWTWQNTQLIFGQQSLWWGPGEGGPMLFSNNSEPIPMLRISRTTPWIPPWPFKLMGPTKFEVFWGWLEGYRSIHLVNNSGVSAFFSGRINPHPFIEGEKISFKPTENVEFGFSATNITGGPGFPLTFHNFLHSYTGGNTLHGGQAGDPGDRRGGFDFSYRLPKLRNWLAFYTDSMCEDELSAIAYPRQCAWAPGLHLIKVPLMNRLEIRAEGVYTDLPNWQGTGDFYSNSHYQSGYTNYGNILGNWIGREGRGFQVWGRYWFSARNSFEFGYRYQGVNKNFLDGGSLNDFSAKADYLLSRDWTVSAWLQHENWQYPLLSTNQKSNTTVSLSFTWYPHAFRL
jgi:membrane-associated phospholipid phosphatase